MRILIITLVSIFTWNTARSQNWEQVIIGTNNDLTHVFFPSESVGYVCGQSGSVFKTVDGGTTWSSLNTGVNSGIYLYRLYFFNETEGFAVGDASTIIHTADGGATWSSYNVPASGDYREIIFWNENEGIILGGSTGNYLLTNDGGNTWSLQPDEFSEPVRGANIINGYLYFVGYYGNIYRMDLQTLQFESYNTPAPYLFRVDGIGEHQMAVGKDGSVVHTNDAWQNSTSIPWNAADWLAEVNFLSGGEIISVGGIVASNTGYIHSSADEGITWDTFTWPEARLFSIHESTTGTVYVSGLDGTLLRRASPTNVCETPITVNLEISACGEFLFDSETVLNETGSYSFNFVTSEGCDSLVILNLTIHEAPDVSVTQSPSACGTFAEITVSSNSPGPLSFQIPELGYSNDNGNFMAPAGNYNITVEDNNGCSTSTNIEVEVPVTCSADFDGDGLVTVLDLMQFSAAYGCSENCCPYDLNSDGYVLVTDLLLFIFQFGSICD